MIFSWTFYVLRIFDTATVFFLSWIMPVLRPIRALTDEYRLHHFKNLTFSQKIFSPAWDSVFGR